MTVEFGSSASAAREYLRRGWFAVPYRPGDPPNWAGWADPTLIQGDLDRLFTEHMGVAILLGSPSGGLVRVGLGCPEAVALEPTPPHPLP